VEAGADLVIFTDLDGTLLDEETYTFEPARPALEALHAGRVPLILCSSKTRAEMEPLARRLGLGAPLIVENGGAIVVPEGFELAPGAGLDPAGGPHLVRLGAPREALLLALPEIAGEVGVSVRPFSEMSAEVLAALSGLPSAAAELALRREHDEPFMVEGTESRDPSLDERFDQAARRRGLRVSRGGRFYHLTDAVDKGRAVHALLALWSGGVGLTAGLGDAANDLPMLEAVDRPIVMPGRNGLDPTLAAALPRAERAPGPGPGGWSSAVLAVLAGETLPEVAA
jgi:mannosyl-3-phosphoglycerate phosphatase